MRQTGVLTAILPETEKWGIDAIPGLVRTERDLGWTPDPMLKLEAMLPPDAVRMAALSARLRMSRAEAERLAEWALSSPVTPGTDERRFARLLYRGKPGGIADRLRLALASARSRAVHEDAALHEAAGYLRLLKFLSSWQKPQLPVRGTDLAALGIAPGKAMGDVLRQLEKEWIDGDFCAGRDALLERAAQLASGASD